MFIAIFSVISVDILLDITALLFKCKRKVVSMLAVVAYGGVDV